MKVNKLFLSAFFISLTSVVVTAQTRGEIATEFQGEGTESDPYLISTAAELRKLADDVENRMTYRGEYFKLANDIVVNENVLNGNGDLNEDLRNSFEQWKPIGTETTHFCGTFDGANHTIYGLYMYLEEEKYGGLMGYLSGTVKNLVIKDSYFGGNGRFGCVAAYAVKVTINGKDYNAYVSNCINYGRIESLLGYCGGICGTIRDCTISKCANFGHITSTGNGVYKGIGGIVGNAGGLYDYQLGNSTIIDCCNVGLVDGRSETGGIAGTLSGSESKICNSVNHSVINSVFAVGGISGHTIKCPTIDGCVNYGKIVSEREDNKGAIAGYFSVPYPTFLLNNAYLETSCDYFAFGDNQWESTETYWNRRLMMNNRVMTKREMQQQSFLDELNQNAVKLGAEYSKWKFGSDGFPTLEWVDEMITAGIEQIAYNGKGTGGGQNCNIYNLSGQMVRANSTDTDNLPNGIYVISGKKVVVTK